MEITVLFLPYSSDKNPYQSRLADALAQLGARVVFVPPGAAPLRRALRIQIAGGLDIVHLHWTSPFLVSSSRRFSLLKGWIFLLTVCWFKVTGVKLVWSVHNLTSHEKLNPGVELYFNRRLSRWVDQIIVHCPSAVEEVMQAFSLHPKLRNKISVIPHGHFIDEYPMRISPDEARMRLNLGKAERAFLYFGQIRPYKNVLALVEAFQRLDDPHARLIIAGEPCDEALRQVLEAKLKNDIRITAQLSWIPDQELPVYIAAADIVVLPFTDILTSSTVILAMSFGKPVITPALGCSRDLLAQQDELLYPVDAPDGLYRAMQKALTLDLRRLGDNNQAQIRSDSWQDAGQATYRLYQQVLGIE
jgi:beta-1,4-mannosyltransferase